MISQALRRNCGVISILVLLDSTSFAKNKVDVHGLSQDGAQKLLETYTPQIQNIESQIMKEFLNPTVTRFNFDRTHCLRAKKNQLLAIIQQDQQVAFTDLQTVYYQDKTIYTTLEVIEDPNSKRMRFVSKPTYHRWDAVKSWLNRLYRRLSGRTDLIIQMQQYDQMVAKLSITHQLEQDDNDCPAYHCLVAFHHPSLVPYWDIFQQGVVQEKFLVLNTLHRDPDPERRAAAAFLVGHFSDPKEIIAALSSCVDDRSSLVRNNALRVIAQTLFKAQLTDIDSLPFIQLLDSPYLTDRNKALSILIALAGDPKNKEKIIRYGGQAIIDLLYLTQPNNHDLAYHLLKKISQQHFGEHQFSQWTTWMKHAQGRDHAFK